VEQGKKKGVIKKITIEIERCGNKVTREYLLFPKE
jgi:hypothetical protein